MVSAAALFVIVAVTIIVGFGISAYLFVYRRTRSCSGASDHSALPLHLPSPQKPGSFLLDTILLFPPPTVPPTACRRSSRPLPPLFQSSASSYVTLSSFPPLLPTAAAPERRQVADTPHHPSRHHASAEDDDANLYLHYWPQTPSTASQSSNAFSPTSSPENSSLFNYHHGMRQAAFTALRRSSHTPALDFGSLPTFDISSGTPPNLGVGPSNPVPLPRPNSSSSSTMVSNLPTRSPYENPFANPSPSQQLDYFNCKPLPVPSSQLEQHPYRCKVSSPLSHSSAAPRSYWSPAVTPAPLQVLTRSSSPVLSSAGITPDDTGNLFPYISYESSPGPTPAPVPLPTPPPSSATASFSSAIATSSLIDIKIYFFATHDLVKIRLPGSASLEDLKSKAAERMSAGCKSLHVAKAGVDTRDPSDVAKADLDELGGERQWRSWLEAVTRADRSSGAGKQRRIVLWAM